VDNFVEKRWEAAATACDYCNLVGGPPVTQLSKYSKINKLRDNFAAVRRPCPAKPHEIWLSALL